MPRPPPVTIALRPLRSIVIGIVAPYGLIESGLQLSMMAF
jgi:hypothetical protein